MTGSADTAADNASIGFSIDDGGALRQLTRNLATAAATAQIKAIKVTRHAGMLLQTRVKAKAQGRPGPRMQTGDYSRSIALRQGVDAGAVFAEVGTNRPQGRRLEFGFVGTDSLGRSYDQPALPHFGPALDEIEPLFVAGLAGIMGDELSEAKAAPDVAGPRQRDAKGRFQ